MHQFADESHCRFLKCSSWLERSIGSKTALNIRIPDICSLIGVPENKTRTGGHQFEHLCIEPGSGAKSKDITALANGCQDRYAI